MGQHMDRIVDVTVVLQHQVPTSQTVQKTVEVSTVPAEVVGGLGAAEAATEAAAPLYCKSTSHAYCCELSVPCDVTADRGRQQLDSVRVIRLRLRCGVASFPVSISPHRDGTNMAKIVRNGPHVERRPQ